MKHEKRIDLMVDELLGIIPAMSDAVKAFVEFSHASEDFSEYCSQIHGMKFDGDAADKVNDLFHTETAALKKLTSAVKNDVCDWWDDIYPKYKNLREELKDQLPEKTSDLVGVAGLAHSLVKDTRTTIGFQMFNLYRRKKDYNLIMVNDDMENPQYELRIDKQSKTKEIDPGFTLTQRLLLAVGFDLSGDESVVAKLIDEANGY